MSLSLSQTSLSDGSPAYGRRKVYYDPVHGYIELDDAVLQFMDTPQVQRLRDLRQLGASFLVFPGATHDRFSHSVGVSHVSGRMVELLRQKQPELEITPEEAMGLRMVDALVDDAGLDVERDWVESVKGMIVGTPPPGQRGRKFLYEIVNNERNGIDTDKFDYLARDSRQVGLSSSFDATRLLGTARVISDQVCFHAKEVFTLHELLHTRYSLFKQIYTHRATKAAEYMLSDILVDADLAWGGRLSRACDDPAEYLHVTDAVLRQIEAAPAECPAMERAQAVALRLRKRQLYRFVDELVMDAELARCMPEGGVKPEHITAHNKSAEVRLHPDDVIVHNLKLNFGSQQNPIERTRFYRDRDSTTSFRIPPHKVSHIIPREFEERVLRVYSRSGDPASVAAIQVAFRAFLRQFSGRVSRRPDHGSKVFSLSQDAAHGASRAALDSDSDEPAGRPRRGQGLSRGRTPARFASASDDEEDEEDGVPVRPLGPRRALGAPRPASARLRERAEGLAGHGGTAAAAAAAAAAAEPAAAGAGKAAQRRRQGDASVRFRGRSAGGGDDGSGDDAAAAAQEEEDEEDEDDEEEEDLGGECAAFPLEPSVGRPRVMSQLVPTGASQSQRSDADGRRLQASALLATAATDPVICGTADSRDARPSALQPLVRSSEMASSQSDAELRPQVALYPRRAPASPDVGSSQEDVDDEQRVGAPGSSAIPDMPGHFPAPALPGLERMRGAACLAAAAALGLLGARVALADCAVGDARQMEFCGPELAGRILASRELPLGRMDAVAFADARQVCQAPPGAATPYEQARADPSAEPSLGGCTSRDMWGDGRLAEQRERENVPFAMAATTCLGRITRLVCAVHAGNKGASYYQQLDTSPSHDSDRDDCGERGALMEPTAADCCDVLMACNVPSIARTAGDSAAMTLSEWCTAKVWNDGQPVQCSAAASGAVTMMAVLLAAATVARAVARA
ncbi:hypothetical protein FNF31_02657 [Cafeteria roenbergensis]|uniref:HD/PDEase domain-containing protein n=1 Tax=Cafeteria roenbergensis TaxID=33653 RepID=A0A5A8DE64_CAFRO|nr:hypothetical protein FNF31_02657 [Cafeteria roenbergensis]